MARHKDLAEARKADALRQRVEELEWENDQLRDHFRSCEGRYQAQAEAAEAKLARIVALAYDGQNRDALHAFDALLKIERLAAAKGE